MGNVTSAAKSSKANKSAWAIAIKERREEVVGSQEEMAMQADISQSLISQIERGVQNPVGVSVERFSRILKVLNWTAQEFFVATGIDMATGGLLDTSDIDKSASHSAAALYPDVPTSTPDIPDALLEAADLYGGSPEFAGLREPRWQNWLARAPHKRRPQTAGEWLQFYSSVKDTFEP